MRKANQIFGYGLYAIGAIKIIFVILIIISFLSSLSAISNGKEVDAFYTTVTYAKIVLAIGFAQIALAIGSIVMIILNIKKCPEVIMGYVMGLGAVLIDVIVPSGFGFYKLFLECGLYMKAGSKIAKINSNYSYSVKPKTSKAEIEDTNWFYENENNQNSSMQTKNQKKIAKIEKELIEWKELLDSGEIDEQTYNEETNRLLEKKKRL